MTKRKFTTIEVKRAGDSHQVVTATRDGGASAELNAIEPCMRKPCQNCPWKINSIGEFPAEAFQHSAKTAYDMSTSIFGCHQSGVSSPSICAGFILHGSMHNLSMRLLYAKNKIPAISDGGHAMFNSYREMAEANGVPENHPSLTPCRD